MAPKKQVEPDEVMIVNDLPGEECRIAILQDNHLEELFTERTATATDVGNIYKGRVTNVEPAIQAAFVDYGQGANGFLHISDLHPKYFPGSNGKDRTERVGRKIPRRDRPPIQAALHRGDEILVQVLKEGIGTKGPTLTSYLSIPGRLLVMMPDMDRVGVSRKVEDETQRREMREILDSLDLPDGFGFILRTAGYGKTKTELKRDAAYLTRLWKVMEKRIKSVGAPCELYTESDLLIRSIRDVLRPSIKAIVVDSESAYQRCSAFLRVVSPRSAPKVIRYRRPAPIFHAFDIERQIELIHSREVPLASGGRLVIDQTEALVAIDVNSGRSRSARDSETNAYETNVEAADEICRQLRLRDLGGLIVNDLIDMRSAKHRKMIEERFAANLKRDRAKATALSISEFGILEMTRQRMRPSLRKSHFMDCPHCNGHGEIKVPEYVAADATRHIGFLLQYERVDRVEVVCSPRVASVMLSGKRRELVRLEDSSGKKIDVRVSDAIAVDRVDYYAYDQRNADIDIQKLPPLKLPTLAELETEQVAGLGAESTLERTPEESRRPGPADATAIALAGGFDDELDLLEDEPPGADEELEAAASSEQAASPTAGQPSQAQRGEGGSRRRRRRGDRRSGEQPVILAGDADALPSASPELIASMNENASGVPGAHGSGGRRSRRRRGRRRRHDDQAPGATPAIPVGGDPSQPVENAAAASLPNTDIPMVPADGHPVRVHELAKELSVTSKEVIDRSEPDPGVHHLSSPLSTVSSDEAQTIRNLFVNGAGEPTGIPADTSPAAPTIPGQAPHAHAGSPGSGRRSRRRRGRRRKGDRQSPESSSPEGHTQPIIAPMASSGTQRPNGQGSQAHEPPSAPQDQNQRRSRRRRRGRRGGDRSGMPMNAANLSPGGAPVSQPVSAPSMPVSPASSPVSSTVAPSQTNLAPAKKPRRALYRAGRTRVSPAAREALGGDDD
ncbi:MAG: translation initiation factor IF-2 N-terminal domain-containing protein [Phycisphaerales bacterium]|nr:translation initiation factor IF-2 N-terminal domain-containing protein [Phycisphaerales bacterium]MCI0674240.1 translation initiation factor IF-2 N-terminal domain-containing protein [Phycisphaerales bacterium]